MAVQPSAPVTVQQPSGTTTNSRSSATFMTQQPYNSTAALTNTATISNEHNSAYLSSDHSTAYKLFMVAVGCCVQVAAVAELVGWLVNLSEQDLG